MKHMFWRAEAVPELYTEVAGHFNMTYLSLWLDLTVEYYEEGRVLLGKKASCEKIVEQLASLLPERAGFRYKPKTQSIHGVS
jgi:hypothetical protein